MTPLLLIRPCAPSDLPAVTVVYAWNVLHGTGTFELDPPDEMEMARRHRDLRARGLHWLVAQRGNQVLGYACADQFRPREAFRFCVGDSAYVAPDSVGQGVGRSLLAELTSQCATLGTTQMLAVIGDAANVGSIALHRSMGFELAGKLKAVGWKFDPWLNVVLTQRRLGPDHESYPEERTNDITPITEQRPIQIEDARHLDRHHRRQSRPAPFLSVRTA